MSNCKVDSSFIFYVRILYCIKWRVALAKTQRGNYFRKITVIFRVALDFSRAALDTPVHPWVSPPSEEDLVPLFFLFLFLCLSLSCLKSYPFMELKWTEERFYLVRVVRDINVHILGWPYVPVFRDLSRFYEMCPGVPTACAKNQSSPGFLHVRKEMKSSTRILELSFLCKWL